MGIRHNELLPGTLDLMILQAVERAPAHGYSIMESIWAGSGELFRVEEGALYPALHRLQLKGWLKAQWGASEANRKAKFYELTAAGRRQLVLERKRWDRLAAGMTRLLES
ncbi:MAG: PadR family transcriptional regulator [Acidobacteria bacterium]|nr:PadR family transcriptional regulator [Acidobacteriota bacterium]